MIDIEFPDALCTEKLPTQQKCVRNTFPPLLNDSSEGWCPTTRFVWPTTFDLTPIPSLISIITIFYLWQSAHLYARRIPGPSRWICVT